MCSPLFRGPGERAFEFFQLRPISRGVDGLPVRPDGYAIDSRAGWDRSRGLDFRGLRSSGAFMDLQALDPLIGELGEIGPFLIGDHALEQRVLFVDFALQDWSWRCILCEGDSAANRKQGREKNGCG